MNNRIIWKGPTAKMPLELSQMTLAENSVSPEEGCAVLLSSGDLVRMPSEGKLTKEQQRPLNEIILKIWEKLTEEEKKTILREELLLTEK